jgi:HK97 family phage prohead protease
MKIERKFLPAAVVTGEALGDRQIRVIASTPTSDRARDIMVPKGCVIDAYRANPVFLADHDATKPIGRATITIGDDQVTALVDFAPAGVSAKADEYCGLAKAGVLNAVSIGFRAIEWEPLKNGGIKYTRWELMELSMVAVPCNPEALVVQRSVTSKASEPKSDSWKCGASRNLPVGPDEAWDAEAAAKSIFDHCGFDGDKPDINFARKAFLAYDANRPGDRGAYKGAFAKMIDGRLFAMPAGLRAASARAPEDALPGDLEAKAKAMLGHYETKRTAAPVAKSAIVTKGLWEVATLAQLLSSLGYAHDYATWEAELEGDGSKVPAMLATALRALADAFIAMSQEEVSELLAGSGLEDVGVDEIEIDVELAAAPTRVKVFKAAFKSGRVLSAANVAHLDTIKKCLDGMAACHVKAADTSDELRGHLEELLGHIDEATKSAKKLGAKKTPKTPTDDGSPDDGSDEGGNTDDANTDDDDANTELGFQVAQRKREADLLALGAL